jgi:hypothetical protein
MAAWPESGQVNLSPSILCAGCVPEPKAFVADFRRAADRRGGTRCLRPGISGAGNRELWAPPARLYKIAANPSCTSRCSASPSLSISAPSEQGHGASSRESFSRISGCITSVIQRPTDTESPPVSETPGISIRIGLLQARCAGCVPKARGEPVQRESGRFGKNTSETDDRIVGLPILAF